MKHRGKLDLINHTVYDWIKTDQQNYKMASWQFPDIIPANCAVEIFIEWEKTRGARTFGAAKQDGTINYVLFGSCDRSFQILASSQGEYDVQIRFLNLATEKCPIGSVVDLAWEYSDDTYFKLWGKADEFYSEMSNLENVNC